jgi:hypothetical protein
MFHGSYHYKKDEHAITEVSAHVKLAWNRYITRSPRLTEEWQRHGISSIYKFPKAVLGVLQAIATGYTLYRACGDQISRYGYAAFGLAVTPYLLMSILNRLAEALTPTYPTYHLVRSDAMTEAELRHKDNC